MGGKRALAGALNPNYPPKINKNPQKWYMEKHIVEEIVAKSVFFFLWKNAVEISAEDKTLCSCCNPMIIDPKQNLPTLFYYIIINGSLSLFFFSESSEVLFHLQLLHQALPVLWSVSAKDFGVQ